MSDTGQVALGVVRVQAQQRADMLNSQFLSPVEWNASISSSYKELYDHLITNYGENYFVAPSYNFLANGTQYFPLPDGSTTVDSISSLVAAPIYKLLGVEAYVGGSWVTLTRFEFIDRNRQQPLSNYTVLGRFNLKYKIIGTQIWFDSIPTVNLRLWYVPKPVNLQPVITCTTQSSTTTLCADTSQLVVGQNIADYAIIQGATAVFPSGTTVSTITANTSFTTNNASTASATMLAAVWSDTYTFDAVSGWEEYIVLDAAIKALIKEESDPSALLAQKSAMAERITACAPNRDAAIAPTVSDTASFDSPWGQNGGRW